MEIMSDATIAQYMDLIFLSGFFFYLIFFFTKYYLKLTIKLFVCLCVTSWHNFRALPDRFDILFHHYLPPIYPARLVSGALLFIGVIHQEKEENQEAKEIQEVGDLKLP